MIISAEWAANSHITAFATCRQGGVSQAPFDSFNLAHHVNDRDDHVQHNRHLLGQYLPLGCSVQWLNQVHGTTLHRVDGSRQPSQLLTGDGLYTETPGVALSIMTADCLPVLICNKQGTAIAALHAGWRSLAAGIIAEGVSQFRCAASDLSVWLGPHISQAYFEVGSEVYDALLKTVSCDSVGCVASNADDLKERWFKRSNLDSNKFMVSLADVARLQCVALGVSQVSGGGHCTYEDKHHFYSYRRDGVTGRMASVIALGQPSVA